MMFLRLEKKPLIKERGIFLCPETIITHCGGIIQEFNELAGAEFRR
jgi:hypothetical protein